MLERRRRHRDGVHDASLAAFARCVRQRFPGAPPGEELRVARFACRPDTDRIGALVGADGYLDHAVELAVLAHLRHRHTNYEALLAHGLDRDEARARVQPAVLAAFARWARGAARAPERR